MGKVRSFKVSESEMNLNFCSKLLIILMVVGITSIIIEGFHHNYQANSLGLEPPQSKEEPTINDPDLKIEVIVEGLELPTAMTFLGDNDFLVLEKETGAVMRIINGTLPDKPLLDLNVATEIDRGLLGVSSSSNSNGKDYVFLYFTETKNNDGEDVTDGTDPLGNRLYRYELVDNKLVNPKLLLDLPVDPNRHPGGQIEIDKNGNLFIIIGDIDHYTKAQNIENGTDPDGTSGILRLTLDGDPVGDGVIGNSFPLNLYYAYGIRNSFGMDFDPVTGKLWASENGESVGDEINLVEPGFNSGWRSIQGIWAGNEGTNASEVPLADYDKLNLVNFDGKGKYSDPELTWHDNVGLTALKFLDSDKLGRQYENEMFVGDFNNGDLFHFDLNEKRTELSLIDPLKDGVVDKLDEQEGNVLGQVFGGISDIEVGPDGYLYIITIGQGKIFKIVPG